MSTEENKAVVSRAIEEHRNKGKMAVRDKRLGLLVRAVLAGSLALFGLLPGRGVALAATPPQCAPPATPVNLAGILSPISPLPILNSPGLLQAFVLGTGTFEAHIVFEPIPAPPPAISDGCKEDSRFTVYNFMGTLFVAGPVAQQLGLPQYPNPILSTIQSTNASLEVHFGPEPNRPMLTLRSDVPVLFFPPGGLPPVPVRLLQIVGLQVIAGN